MKSDMIWAYLIHLSTHMWDDENSPNSSWFTPSGYSENNNVDIETWDNVIKFLAECKYNTVLIDVGDAIKYESHPEISAPDAWDKDFLKKKLDEIRALGMTPVPKLNFSAGHDTWMKKYRRMLSTPEYYAMCSDVIREVCEAFGYPKLFHIGFDEEVTDKQSRHEIIMVRGEKLWWHDFNFICKECEKHGARPWIWSDYCWGNKELFIKNMSKSILQSNWFYGPFVNYPSNNLNAIKIETYQTLNELGFEQVPTCSTWQTKVNSYQTLAYGKARISPESLKGYMTAPWAMTTRRDYYTLLSDADRLYTSRMELYPETLEEK